MTMKGGEISAFLCISRIIAAAQNAANHAANRV